MARARDGAFYTAASGDPLHDGMEAESIPSLSPLIESADQWGELLLLLPLLVALEAVLSADNAIALAAISRQLKDSRLQGQALNLGLALALVFRLLLIAAARWVLDFWPLQLLAAAYLLWLASAICCRNGRSLAPHRRRRLPMPQRRRRGPRSLKWGVCCISAAWRGWWPPWRSRIWPSRSIALLPPWR